MRSRHDEQRALFLGPDVTHMPSPDFSTGILHDISGHNLIIGRSSSKSREILAHEPQGMWFMSRRSGRSVLHAAFRLSITNGTIAGNSDICVSIIHGNTISQDI